MFIKPSFYDKFKCKADKCTDSCCVGWEIDIDEFSLEMYSKISGSFGDRLRQSIVTDSECSYFDLSDNERCPFLCDNGLCDIYINLGEDALCEICSEHPRFYSMTGDVTFAGLGLCCEKVCEMLFDSNYELEFVSDEELIFSDIFESMLKIVRKKDYDIIEKMNSILLSVGYSGEKLSLNSEMLNRIISAFIPSEAINDEWTFFISNLSENSSELLPECIDWYNKDYSKLLAYALYRYLPECEYDGDAVFRTLFCCVSVCFVMICDMLTYKNKGEISFSDRTDNVKRWSKQIEYSTENINIVMSNF